MRTAIEQMAGSGRYTLAPDGVFSTIQGEGQLSGLPMVFVRLAGCPVGCYGCDTDYAAGEKGVSAAEIGRRAAAVRPAACEWTWVTGGEPAAYDLWPLLESLRLVGRVAVATSGVFGTGAWGRLADFLSVSPHGSPAHLRIARGSQINLVPGLGGLRLSDWSGFDFGGFGSRYVTPFDGRPETLSECVSWAGTRKGWRLGCQSHKHWGLA